MFRQTATPHDDSADSRPPEGRLEALETLEQLVRSGVEWPLIEAAADPATLRALKERLPAERTNGHPDDGDQSKSPESPR